MDFLNRVTRKNVLHTMAVVRQRSTTLQKLIDGGQIVLVGGIYDVESGRVEFINDAVPAAKEASLAG